MEQNNTKPTLIAIKVSALRQDDAIKNCVSPFKDDTFLVFSGTNNTTNHRSVMQQSGREHPTLYHVKIPSTEPIAYAEIVSAEHTEKLNERYPNANVVTVNSVDELKTEYNKIKHPSTKINNTVSVGIDTPQTLQLQ